MNGREARESGFRTEARLRQRKTSVAVAPAELVLRVTPYIDGS